MTTSRAPAEPLHPCLRCERPVPLDVALCEYCNPLGLPQPASSQVHGTVFVAVAGAVLLLAVVGKLAISGIGPFSGSVLGVAPASQGGGLAVTIRVTNEGTSSGAATCRVYDPADGTALSPRSGYLTTPRVPAGESLSFEGVVTELGGRVRQLAVACQGP